MANKWLAAAGAGLETVGRVGVEHFKEKEKSDRAKKLAEVENKRKAFLDELKHSRQIELEGIKADLKGPKSRYKLGTIDDGAGGKRTVGFDEVTGLPYELDAGPPGATPTPSTGSTRSTSADAVLDQTTVETTEPGAVTGGRRNPTRGVVIGDRTLHDGLHRDQWKPPPGKDVPLPTFGKGEVPIWNVREGKFVPIREQVVEIVKSYKGMPKGSKLTGEDAQRYLEAMVEYNLVTGIYDETDAQTVFGNASGLDRLEAPVGGSSDAQADVPHDTLLPEPLVDVGKGLITGANSVAAGFEQFVDGLRNNPSAPPPSQPSTPASADPTLGTSYSNPTVPPVEASGSRLSQPPEFARRFEQPPGIIAPSAAPQQPGLIGRAGEFARSRLTDGASITPSEREASEELDRATREVPSEVGALVDQVHQSPAEMRAALDTLVSQAPGDGPIPAPENPRKMMSQVRQIASALNNASIEQKSFYLRYLMDLKKSHWSRLDDTHRRLANELIETYFTDKSALSF